MGQDDSERRQRALDMAFGRFDAVAARMKEVYGLRLPRHVAVWAALGASLSDPEWEGLQELGWSSDGIMVWFEDGGLDRATRDGLDPRLHMRFRRDPPEFVTVMMGHTDGLHFGLWYDDPAELPSGLVHNYARDSAETWVSKPTVVGEIARRVRREIEEPDYPDEPAPSSLQALADALEWFRDADDKALAEGGPRRWAQAPRGEILGGAPPALLESSGDPRATRAAVNERYAAYCDKSGGAQVSKWVDEAMAELGQGKPAFALTLGRELHWLDAASWREKALELLCAAYGALGRHALADIARAHYAHRDLRSVDVY